MHEQEAIFWSDFGGKDEFKEAVNKVISKIENICEKIIEKK